MSVYEAIVVGTLALFALAGLRWHDRRGAGRAEASAEKARLARAAAQSAHDTDMAPVAAKATTVAAAKTGAGAFNAAFDD